MRTNRTAITSICSACGAPAARVGGSGAPPLRVRALASAIEQIREFRPGALVVALGLDGFEGDPFGGLSISTSGFGAIASVIAGSLQLPTLIVQEGGYLCDELGENLSSFLMGFQGA